MDKLIYGLVGALLSSNQPVALSNLVAETVGVSVSLPDWTDPVEKEYRQLLEEDDAASEEVDRWIKEKGDLSGEGQEVENALLRARIRQRLTEVQHRYEKFIREHPRHSKARLAYGSFLMDTGEEEAGKAQYEKALELDPKAPAAWNNLANYYGHRSPVTKAFAYYAKAIELDPTESVYYYNYATTVYLFRKDATNYFKISEQEVFEKAMGLYQKALALDPTNFVLATDVAQSYYGFKLPPRSDPEARRKAEIELADKGIVAWERALPLAGDEIERQGVYLHLARNHINAGRLEEARRYLDRVEHQMFARTKEILLKKLARREEEARAGPDPRAGFRK